MDEDKEPGSRKFLYIAVCTGNLIALTSGIASTWSSPVISKIKVPGDQNPLPEPATEEVQSWIGSLLALGAVFGPFVAGYLREKIGGKKTLLACAGVPMIVSFLILAFAQSTALYYVARLLGGLAMGGVYTVLPNFNSEIAEDAIRGGISSSMNVFITTGQLFSYLIGPYISIMWFSLICAVVPCIFVVAFFVFVPESPYYLISKSQYQAAETSLKKFRSTSNAGVQKEIQKIKEIVEESQANKVPFLSIFKSKAIMKAFVITWALMAFQQFSGINIILFYAQTIFEDAGSSLKAEVSSIVIGAVQFFASFVTPLVVDRLGRRFMFLISAVGMIIAEAALGVYFYLKDDGQDVSSISWLPIVSLVAYIITYNLGFGPLPWTVMAELFPSSVKGGASIATACFCWVLGFLLTRFFAPISDSIGNAGTFWFFSACCVLAVIFVFFFMPETKGKSFQEIEAMLKK